MSIIIIAFPAAPKVDPEAKRKDEELNRLLKQKVTGTLSVNHKYFCPVEMSGCFCYRMVGYTSI